jgi:hypothetical protein
MKFDVTYWQPAQYSAVAEAEEVTLALADMIANGHFSDSYTARAATVLTQLANGFEPTDLGIIAIALRAYGFAAPKGTEPGRVDEAADYTAEVHPS